MHQQWRRHLQGRRELASVDALVARCSRSTLSSASAVLPALLASSVFVNPAAMRAASSPSRKPTDRDHDGGS
jgi:hypothetical protein